MDSCEKKIVLEKEIIRITRISAVLNISLALVKCSAGVITGSLAIFSDGIHSFSDLISDFIVFMGVRLAGKPPDKNHHFGHASYEIFAEVFVVVLLMLAGGGIIKTGIMSIYSGEGMVFSRLVLVIALLSVAMKEWLYRWTVKKARELSSEILMVNAWHHRSDALSSVAVIIGALFLLKNFKYADSVAGIIVGVMLFYVAIKFLIKCFADLTDSSPGKDVEEQINKIIQDYPGVDDYHNLRIRKVASTYYMDVHIKVDPDLTVKHAHDLASGLEARLRSSFPVNIHILTHIEPYNK